MKASNLILDVREDAENQDVSSTIGIPDETILRHLNNAQKRIFALIKKSHPKVFDVTSEVSVSAGQEYIDLPRDCFMFNSVSDVKFATSQNAKVFHRLYPDTKKKDLTKIAATPDSYYRESGKLFLMPPPSGAGKVILTYTKKLPVMELKRAVVDSATLNTANNTITSLILDVTSEEIDLENLSKSNRLSIVDEDGNIKMSHIKFTNINTSTGEVTINPSFAFQDGETIESGDIVVAKEFSSTFSQLDEYVERYLVAYTVLKILQREGSNEVAQQTLIVKEMEDEIVMSYQSIEDDTFEIPNIISSDEEWF